MAKLKQILVKVTTEQKAALQEAAGELPLSVYIDQLFVQYVPDYPDNKPKHGGWGKQARRDESGRFVGVEDSPDQP